MKKISEERIEDEYCEDEDMRHLFNAIMAARMAFEKYFEKKGLDAAYWQLELTGFVLSSNFKAFKRLAMDERGTTSEDPYGRGDKNE